MAATGNPIGAKEAYEIGLVDRLIEGDLLQHAVAYADEVPDTARSPRASERDDKLAEARANPGLFDEFRKANARKFRGFDAPEYNIRAIEAAVAKPYAEGVLDRTPAVHGADERHPGQGAAIFLLRRAQGRQDRRPARGHVSPRDIRKVGVIGAGTMGGGISMNFLSAGIPVTIVEMAAGSARPRHRRDAQELRGDRAKGKMTPSRSARRWACSSPRSTSTRSPIATSSSRPCSRIWT
jgi:3-hydroxyacyl-CoA dehydrogenase